MPKRFLDIGDGGGVFLSDVILILNAENSTTEKTTLDFLKKNKANAILPKKALSRVNSIVITEKRGSTAIYSSPYSANLLTKRANKKI